MDANTALIFLIDKFVSGEDQSTRLIGRIESLLVDAYFGTDVFDVVAEAASLYRPGAKPPYIDEAEMATVLSEARRMVG